MTATIPVGQFPRAVAFGEGSVWVAVNNPDPPEHWVLVRIDPETNEIVKTIPLEGAADVAVGAGGV